MKIVIAPDSFKGSLTAHEVSLAIEYGFSIHFPNAEYVLAPMADGGEGTLKAIFADKKEDLYAETVHDPLGNLHKASYGILKTNTESGTATQLAVIEMAEASGLELVPKNLRNPLFTSSFGTGELILAALDQGCRNFIITLGGSATCDAGMGALAALGLQFKDVDGNSITPNGESMQKIHSIDISNLDPRLSASFFTLAHDVDNPLLGLEGALMYAAQKGANAEQVEILHKGFEQFAHRVQSVTQKNISTIPGGGAAGGLGAGLYGFLNAEFKSGAMVVSDAIHLAAKMQDATLVITGEGQIDNQTAHGKAPIRVAQLAKKYNIPVIAFCGNIKEGFEEVYHQGIDAVFSIVRGPMSETEAIRDAKPLLVNLANNIARFLKLNFFSKDLGTF